jgi:hypothetical protein
LRWSIDNRELLMPRYFFNIKDGRRLVDPSGLDCLDDADAISKGEAMARQIEADGPVDMYPAATRCGYKRGRPTDRQDCCELRIGRPSGKSARLTLSIRLIDRTLTSGISNL